MFYFDHFHGNRYLSFTIKMYYFTLAIILQEGIVIVFLPPAETVLNQWTFKRYIVMVAVGPCSTKTTLALRVN